MRGDVVSKPPVLPLIAALCAAQQAWARADAALPLYMMTMPPMVIDEPGRRGAVGDVVLEAMRRAGLKVQILVEPNPRALAVVKDGKDLFIAAVSRIPERERDYTWIAPIASIERAFYTLDKSIASFDEARRLLRHIGVSRDTANHQVLLAEGFKPEQLVPVNAGVSAPRMLLAGRIDAWFNLVPESETLLQLLGEPRLKRGKLLAPADLYLACSRSCSADHVARLQKAIAAMRADGSLRRLMDRYAGEPGFVSH